MNFDDSPEEAEFRAQVRSWLSTHAPAFVIPPELNASQKVRIMKKWFACKDDAGYSGITLPREIGGRGGTPIEAVIFNQEEARYFPGDADTEGFSLGAGMAIPTIRAHAQTGWLEKLTKPTLRADILWCQLFSEPSAGSDLAGIRTRAAREGDDWVVNGQKVWTSGAHNADWGLLIVRTDSSRPKHKGLTYFLVDMKSPGVEVRPLKQISGRAEFNEVFFSDVRIPDDQRLGEINGGWTVAMTTLSNERLTLGGDSAVGRNLIAPLVRLASRLSGPDGRALTEDGAFRQKLASYQAVVSGMEHTSSRIITALSRGQNPGAQATIGKMILTRWLQEMSAFGMDIAGEAGAVIDAAIDQDLAEIQDCFFLAVGYRMGGGTEEIGKNIIAERVLGLPRELQPPKKVSAAG
jgi:alkylation response protein AidB-like acyl-CoA dehydrogenase